MLFYLTSKDKVNLLDFVEGQIGLIPKKMTGRFSLMQFVVRDMRNYAHIRYFAVQRWTSHDAGCAMTIPPLWLERLKQWTMRATNTMHTAGRGGSVRP